VIFLDDPMLSGQIDWSVLGVVVAKVIIVFVLLLVATMLMIWFERKVVSDMQNRIGPNLAGPFGVLQTLADGIKFFFKEDLVPDRAQRGVFMIAPFLAFVPAFLLFSIVPIGGDFNGHHDGIIHVFGHATFMQVADPPIGILFALAMSSIAVYGVMLAGWSSGSKYPLLGSVRASAQMVSYEAAMGLAVVAVILKSGTLTTHGIVEYQAGAGWWGWVPNWSIIVTGLVPFVIFIIAGTPYLSLAE
jgi:NADH-quinone oxidoreductase subunit H